MINISLLANRTVFFLLIPEVVKKSNTDNTYTEIEIVLPLFPHLLLSNPTWLSRPRLKCWVIWEVSLDPGLRIQPFLEVQPESQINFVLYYICVHVWCFLFIIGLYEKIDWISCSFLFPTAFNAVLCTQKLLIQWFVQPVHSLDFSQKYLKDTCLNVHFAQCQGHINFFRSLDSPSEKLRNSFEQNLTTQFHKNNLLQFIFL